MATIFLEEKTVINSAKERRISAASSCDIVLEGIPGSPDELVKYVRQGAIASLRVASPDGTEATKYDGVDDTGQNCFAHPEISTPMTSQKVTFAAKIKNAVLRIAIDQSLAALTPPKSIQQTSESSMEFDQTHVSRNTNNRSTPQTNPSQVKPRQKNEYQLERAICSQTSENQSSKEMRKTDASQIGTQKIELDTTGIQVIAAIGQKCYLSNTLLAPEDYRARWTATIKPRIDEALVNELPPSNDNQSSLVLVLCMAGTRRKDLKPSILVTCCGDNNKRGKAVMKVLSQLRKAGGLRGPCGNDMPYFVRVQGGFKLLMAGKEMQKPVIEASIDTSHCPVGVSARIRSTAELVGEDAHVKFTLGGMICINERNYYLTTAHHFLLPEHNETDNLDSSSSSTLGNDISDTESLDDGEDEDEESSNSVILNGGIAPLGISEPLEFNVLEHRGIFARVASPYTSQLENTQPGPLGTSDWAVVLAEGNAIYPSPAVNWIHIPGDDNPTFIEKTKAEPEMHADWVWIATGRGLYRGSLNPSAASILIQHSICEVKQIALSSPLGKPECHILFQ
jgi:hypothetical protein